MAELGGFEILILSDLFSFGEGGRGRGTQKGRKKMLYTNCKKLEDTSNRMIEIPPLTRLNV